MDDVGFINLHTIPEEVVPMKVLMVGPLDKAGGVATHTRELTKALRNLGVEVEVYNTSPEKEYPKLLSSLIKFYKRTLGLSLKIVTDWKKFDIVHVQASGPLGGFLSALTGILWKKLLGIRLVITFHYSRESFYSKYRHMLNYIIKISDKFIVVSHRNKRLISKYICPCLHNKIVVVYNGFNSEFFRPLDTNVARRLLGISPEADTKIIVNIANLLPHKGHKYLIEAIRLIQSMQPNFNLKCYIIGRGPLYNELLKTIRRYGLEEHITLTGWVPLEKVRLYLSSADAFVFTSLPQGESFGIVQIEAMGCGVPVIATRNGASEEIIPSEDYGLLCEPGNPEDLAEKILIALEKKWNRKKIRKYAEQFTWEKIAKKQIKVYRMLKGDLK